MAPARIASMGRGHGPNPPDETTSLGTWVTLTTVNPSNTVSAPTAVATATHSSLSIDVIVNKTKITARAPPS